MQHTKYLILPVFSFGLLPAVSFAQGIDAASLMITGRPADARADAMGGGDVAMPGDVRNMVQSPAALTDIVNGLELSTDGPLPTRSLSMLASSIWLSPIASATVSPSACATMRTF